MNCEKAQLSILLADSGELSDTERMELDGHLVSCPACQDYGRSVSVLTGAGKSLPSEGPGPFVMARIRNAAAEHVAHPGIARFFHGALPRVAACAAGLAILASVWVIMNSAKPATPTDHVGQLGTLVALASEDDAPALDRTSTENKEQQIRALAEDLLLLQGFGTDTVENGATSGGVPASRDLRSRSIPGSPEVRCG